MIPDSCAAIFLILGNLRDHLFLQCIWRTRTPDGQLNLFAAQQLLFVGRLCGELAERPHQYASS